MELEFNRQNFEKTLNIKFHENPSIGSPAVPCGQTGGRMDMTKLIVTFRNFANAPKKPCHASRHTYIFSAFHQTPTHDSGALLTKTFNIQTGDHAVLSAVVLTTCWLWKRA
jgi:hypothetical protein